MGMGEMFANVFSNIGLYKYRKRATLPSSLEGKTVMITGANAGIGKFCAKTCVGLGAKVVMACRDMDKAKHAVEDIVNEVGQDKASNLVLVELDLSSLDSVRACAKQVNEMVSDLNFKVFSK